MKIKTRAITTALSLAVIGVLPTISSAHEPARTPIVFAAYGPDGGSRDVDWNDLPDPVRRTIRREFGDAPLGLIQYARNGDRQFFRVVIHGPYHDALARIGLDGRLVGVEDIRKPAPLIREPLREPIREPVREPLREPAREPIREPIREPDRDAPRTDYDSGRRDPDPGYQRSDTDRPAYDPGPRDTDRRYTDPRDADPDRRYTDPRDVDPRAADPRAADPRAADPRDADPRYTDSRDVDPRDSVDLRYEPAPAEVDAVYEKDLGDYGHWVDVRDYGRCWVPNDRPREWRPYTVGHWVDTDQGWTWVSEDTESNWGVVTYHYGRWYEDTSYGWVWVPGTVWAPAWVAWREGDGYCGWAPLPPQVGIGVNISISLVDRYCPPERFVYCDERFIGERRVYEHFERNNVTIINKTTNITNVTYVNNHIVNRGVAVENVERRSGRHVERVQLAQAGSASDARRMHGEGRAVVYAPPAVERVSHANDDRLQRAMTQKHPTGRTAVQTPANGSPHERAVERATAQKQADGQAHERAVDRGIVKQEDHVAAHDRAVDRVDAQKQADAEAHQRAVDRANAQKQVDGQKPLDAQKQADAEAHQRAIDRANAQKRVDVQKPIDAQKQADTEAHQRAIDRANAQKQVDGQKQADAEAHQRAIDRANAQKQADAQAQKRTDSGGRGSGTPPADKGTTRTDSDRQAKADAHERAVKRAEAAQQAAGKVLPSRDRGSSKDNSSRQQP